jgi:hypothetical protein
VGFEELGNTDTFSTEVLEARLRRAGACPACPTLPTPATADRPSPPCYAA